MRKVEDYCDQWKQRQLWRTYFEEAAAYEDTYNPAESHEDTGVDMVPFRSELRVRTCHEELPSIRGDLDEAIDTILLSASEALHIYKTNQNNQNVFAMFQN